MQVTNKEIRAFNSMRFDPWGPSANENYNVSMYGMTSSRFYELKKFIESKYGMKVFWPAVITVKNFKEV